MTVPATPPESPASGATSFRTWMECLVSPRAGEPEWPWLLRELLIAEFARQRASEICYAGEVFKDRDADDPAGAVLPEKRAVRELYHRCRTGSGGVFRIGAEAYWLLGYEWPNQGTDRGRRADLVGLSAMGGLAVFECKLANNPYGPFAAVLEGLDYLACLTADANFARVRGGFARWTSRPAATAPEGFRGVQPSPAARHEVIVLATAGYYDRYTRSGRGAGWQAFAGLAEPALSPLSIRFAACDFSSAPGTWVTG